jgi:pimeloyl-ACP methyl ester carboxylesterase
MLKFAEFKKIKVKFSDTGKGRVIVLLHGFLGSHKIWQEYIQRLSKKFRVIAIDLPGHGETPAIGYYHSMEMLAQSVKAMLDSISVRRYVLVGHSMGGYIALAFAELYPENVCGLCLCHSTSFPDSEEKKKDRDRTINLVKKGNKRMVTDVITSHFSLQKLPKIQTKVNQVKQIAEGTSKQSIINSLEGMKERKSRDLILKFSEYPILFIVGKNDSLINSDSVFSQVGLCKFPYVVMMEHEGHMGFYEEPQQVIPQISSFANRCFRNKF